MPSAQSGLSWDSEVCGGAVDTVEAEVRELVRRCGLDPAVDRSVMRSPIDEVVTEYDARSLTASLPRLGDIRQTAKSMYDVVAGYRPRQRHQWCVAAGRLPGRDLSRAAALLSSSRTRVALMQLAAGTFV